VCAEENTFAQIVFLGDYLIIIILQKRFIFLGCKDGEKKVKW